MMEWYSPWALLLLLTLPFVGYLMLRKKRGAAVRFPSLVDMRNCPVSWRLRLRPLLVVARLLCLALLILALARPRKGTVLSEISTEGIAIEAVVDRSGSMQAEMDYDGEKLDRLEVVKRVLTDFVEGDKKDLHGRTGDMIGLGDVRPVRRHGVPAGPQPRRAHGVSQADADREPPQRGRDRDRRRDRPGRGPAQEGRGGDPAPSRRAWASRARRNAGRHRGLHDQEQDHDPPDRRPEQRGPAQSRWRRRNWRRSGASKSTASASARRRRIGPCRPRSGRSACRPSRNSTKACSSRSPRRPAVSTAGPTTPQSLRKIVENDRQAGEDGSQVRAVHAVRGAFRLLDAAGPGAAGLRDAGGLHGFRKIP